MEENKKKMIKTIIIFVLFLLVFAINVYSSCTDSDGGLVYTVKGTVHSGNITVSDYCFDGILTEYNCSGGSIINVTKGCWEVGADYECRNGRCSPVSWVAFDGFPQGTSLSTYVLRSFSPQSSIVSVNLSSPIYPPFSVSGYIDGFTYNSWFYLKSTSYTNDSYDGIAVKNTKENGVSGYGKIYLKDISGSFIMWNGKWIAYDTMYVVFYKYDDGTWRVTERSTTGGGTVTYVSRNDSSSYNWNRMDNLTMLSLALQNVVRFYADTSTTVSGINVYESGAKCNDSDGDYNYTVKGDVTTQSTNYSDYCLDDSVVREYACVDEVMDYIDKNCSDFGGGYVCDDGKCKESLYFCNDSDGGYDIYNKGVVSLYYNNTLNETFIDYCYTYSNHTYLREGVNSTCDIGLISFIEYACPYLCFDGKCVINCTDSDGSNYFLKGTVYYNSTSTSDSCYSGTEVKEQICLNYTRQEIIEDCKNWGSSFICTYGVCSLPYVNCTDSDGLDYFNKGYVLDNSYPNMTFYDECADNDTLWERTCGTYGLSKVIKNCNDFGMKYMCLDGQCVLQPTNCTDSDGVDYWNKGYVTYIPTSTDYYDLCYNSVKVEEFICSGNIVDSVIYDCSPYICYDGTCFYGECSDSDGGIDYFIRGEVVIDSSHYVDYCVDGNVNEYYCENNSMSLDDNHYCDSGCQDGACISLSPSNPSATDLDSPWYRDGNDTMHFNGTMCVNEGWKSMIMCASWKYVEKQAVNGTAWVFSGIHILYFLVILIIIIIIGPLIVEFFKS